MKNQVKIENQLDISELFMLRNMVQQKLVWLLAKEDESGMASGYADKLRSVITALEGQVDDRMGYVKPDTSPRKRSK